MKQISLLVILLCGLSTAVGQTVRQPASKVSQESTSGQDTPEQRVSGLVTWVTQAPVTL